jgi:hypothetical protein
MPAPPPASTTWINAALMMFLVAGILAVVYVVELWTRADSGGFYA